MKMDADTKLSVVIPVYNEVETIGEILDQVAAVDAGIRKDLVVVDDCSTDGTREVLARIQAQHPEWTFVYHERNQGKGAALRTGFSKASGDIVLIQDADLEYDPREYPALLK